MTSETEKNYKIGQKFLILRPDKSGLKMTSKHYQVMLSHRRNILDSSLTNIE